MESSSTAKQQERIGVFTFQRVVALFMICVILGSLGIWIVTHRPFPWVLQIATAEEGGLYFKLAEELAPYIEEVSDRATGNVTVQKTLGSVENRTLLVEDESVDVAIIQSGAVDVTDLMVVTPLYREFVHVIVRRERGMASVRDLENKSVVIGPVGSGMRQSALCLLERYELEPGVNLRVSEHYFTELLTDDSLDAAIVTTGPMNPDLKKVLKTGLFDLIPILDAEALAIHHPHLIPATIPRGLYKEGPPIPDRAIETVATTAMLVVREDASDQLVTDLLVALYENRWRLDTCAVLSPKEAAEFDLYPLHDMTRHYFDPYGGIGILANMMESVAAVKELLFALGAGLYLLWQLRKRKREKVLALEMDHQKEHLDDLLNETVRIERAQMETHDYRELKQYLDEVTQIKLKALDELTVEELRGDRMFSIFLMQCANLIRKIQSKITDPHEH